MRARIALVALAVSVALTMPAEASAADRPTARAATDGYLTIREAKRQIRGRFRRDARRHGYRIGYLEINSCQRWSGRRVRCYYYREDSDDIACEGRMQVIEFFWGWRTQGFGGDCY